MSNFEDFIDKLGPFPNDVNRLARLIRVLDKRLETVQASLIVQQKKFQAKIKELKDKKINDVSPELKAEYESIVAKQKEMYGYAKQKDAVAEQLQCVINNSFEMIRNDLKNKIKDKVPENTSMAISKGKKKTVDTTVVKPAQKQQQFMYDISNPKYCYCVLGSYGEMVGCENLYCEKEWFHVECVGEPLTLDETAMWHCKDCKKLTEKFKNKPAIKQFII